MSDKLLDALGNAVADKVCSVSTCQKRPRVTQNGRTLCDWHWRAYEYGRMGKPCDRCGSRHWVDDPTAATPTCRMCSYTMQQREDVFTGSWDTTGDGSQ
jgi:hypothetical protein